MFIRLNKYKCQYYSQYDFVCNKLNRYTIPCIYFIIILIILIPFASCNIQIPIAPIPDEQINSALNGTTAISDDKLKLLNGIFSLQSTTNNFGDKVIIKSSPGYLSIFCGKNYSFMILKAGSIGNKIIIAGYWRYAVSADIGFVKLEIDSSSGANDILNNIKPKNLKIIGEYYNDNTKYIELNYLDSLKQTDFMIIGHRGGGRNSDRHPASENSLNMIKYAERLGSNGVEIDVRLTKDKVPVLFHDENLNKRLIREDYFIGKISDYSFPMLRSFVTLKNGERIPTLDEALLTIIRETNLKFVWLDVKATGLMPELDKVISKFINLSKELGRDVEIYAGIPDQTIYNEYMNYPNHQNIPSLCELDEEYVINAGSSIWAPRWSLGLLTERVLALQAKGKKVYVWTLDESKFLNSFLGKSYFNGILTNYPAMVAYEYYIF